MATYQLISSSVLSSNAASVTLSSIPSTFTDLCLKMSIRSARSANISLLLINFNNEITGSNYSTTYVYGNSASALSTRVSNSADIYAAVVNADTSTSNTYGNAEFYIPNYTVSQNKPFLGSSVSEMNSGSTNTAWIHSSANLWRNNAAITSIVLRDYVGDNLMAGSSFYLYGISNA